MMQGAYIWRLFSPAPMDNPFLVFAHSLIRYGVLITVAFAGLVHLRGMLFKRPILTYERALSIVAMVLCHVQLVVGLILYLINFKQYTMMQGPEGRFWKMEHIGTMVIAIACLQYWVRAERIGR